MTQPGERDPLPQPQLSGKQSPRPLAVRLVRWGSWLALAAILGVLGRLDFHLWYTLPFYAVLAALVIGQMIVFYRTRDSGE